MNKISKYTMFGIIAIATFIRLISIDFDNLERHMITDYDGLGYYMYLPAAFIHKDIKKFDWVEEIDKKYDVVGGSWKFQYSELENGNHVTTYLGGVAILQLPFFLAAHTYASFSDYPADGFSVPYQLSLSFATLFYFILTIFILRKILLRYYHDEAVAVTLVLLFLASNAIEYISIEAGHCHGYIMFMYALIIGLSIRWHQTPARFTAVAIGLVIGVSTIMRPTELIILLIPLLWNLHSKTSAKDKWALVRAHQDHVLLAVLGAFIGALPQMLYWMSVVGSPVHTIGSKWYFLNPYFRVLFGWHKGWFVYTPVTIFFVAGLFFMKDRPFQKSVIWFCILNIWIVISWSIWRYGGSYSTRALVQSYPVFALALADVVSHIIRSRYKWAFYFLAFYLTAVNLFQIWQYRQGILRHDEMNRGYYQAVYLDANPSPLDMSLLDDGQKMNIDCNQKIKFDNVVSKVDISADEPFFQANIDEAEWIDVLLDIRSSKGFWSGFIVAREKDKEGAVIQSRKYRLFQYLTKHSKINHYHFQLKRQELTAQLELQLEGKYDVKARIHSVNVTGCSR